MNGRSKGLWMRAAGLLVAALVIPACSDYFHFGGGLGNPSFQGVTGELVNTYASNPGSGDDRLLDGVVYWSDMYLVGTEEFSPGTPGANSGWRIEKRLLGDGSLVPAFDGDGVIQNNISTFDDRPNAVVIDIFFVGLYVVGHEGGPSGSKWRIEKRSTVDGVLTPTFGVGGVVLPNLPGSDHSAKAITFYATWLYVVGSHDSTAANPQWRIEKRSRTDGSLDPSFTGGGRILVDPSPGNDEAVAITRDAASMYVLGRDDNAGNARWRIQKRALTTGTIDPWFGGGSDLLIDPSGGDDEPGSIFLAAGWLYIVGTNDNGGDTLWHIEKRNAVTGAPDPAFSVIGCCTSPGPDAPFSLMVIGDDLYVAGWESVSLSNTKWRIEKRNALDGSLITAFGDDPSPGLDAAGGFITLSFTQIVVGGTDEAAGAGDFGWRIEKYWK